jgi:prophage DNA circulation protein
VTKRRCYIIKFWVALFTGDFQGAWDAVKGIVSAGAEAVKGFFTTLVTDVTAAMEAIYRAMTEWLEKAWNKAKEIAGKIRDAIRSAFDKDKKNSPSIMETIKTTVSNVNQELLNFDHVKPLGHSPLIVDSVRAGNGAGGTNFGNSNAGIVINFSPVINNPIDFDAAIEELSFRMKYNYG